MCAEVSHRAHHSIRARNGSLSGRGRLRSYIFVEDSISAETEIWNIAEETSDAWEAPRRGLFGVDSIDAEKTKLGGDRITKALVLGYDIDTDGETIAPPAPIAECDRIYILCEQLVVGSQHVTQKALHPSRGYMQSWLADPLLRASFAQPVDLLLRYRGADSADQLRQIPDSERLLGYDQLNQIVGGRPTCPTDTSPTNNGAYDGCA